MTAKLPALLKRVGKSWVALSAILLLGLMLTRGTPLWAATVREINQTVPPPTATKLPTPVPPATATPKPPSNSGGGQQSSQPTNTPEAQSPNNDKLTGTVKSNTLNLRSGPGTGYLVIGVLKQGDKVEIIEQNAKGDWWRICCLAGTEIRGWVSASFITPDFDIVTSQKLLPVATNVPEPPTPTPTKPAPVAENSSAAAPATGTNIKVEYIQSPAFPLQGMIVTAEISVTNPTSTDAIDVELRDELPKEMTIVDLKASEIAIVTQDVTENLRQVYSILWPTLAPGEVVTVTAQLRIDPSVSNGTVFDNLVFAGAFNVEGSTAGISIGMPPVDLPDFQ